MKVLAGDIGGTKTLLRIVDVEGSDMKVLHEARYLSQNFAVFETLIADYLHRAADIMQGTTRACLGVAGPIRHEGGNSVVQITNLPWRIDSQALVTLIGIPVVHLINDVEAVGYGISGLKADQVLRLQDSPAQTEAVRMIVGAGTGLGVAFLLSDNQGARVLPSQGGHLAFTPSTALEDKLLRYWRESLGRVSWEHLVSGPGLVRIYDFLHHRSGADDNPRHRQIMASVDHSAAIATAAAAGDELCEQALALFIRFYGRVTGDLALATLPFGGVFLAGGIAPKIGSHLADGAFMEEFREKGVMTSLMSAFPVAVVLDPFIGVSGAAVCAATKQ